MISNPLTGRLPNLLAMHGNAPQRYPFLLESVAGDNARTAQFSLLLACPESTLVLRDKILYADQNVQADNDFLAALDRLYRQNPLPASAGPDPSLPFHGGWFVYLGYELAAQIEPCLKLHAATGSLPTALAVRCPAAIVIDHRAGQYQVVVEADHPQRQLLRQQIEADIEICRGQGDSDLDSEPLSVQSCIEDDDKLFLDAVGKIQDYLRAGDVFQVNLSRQWQLHTRNPVSAAALYQRLCRANPAPFAGIFQWQDAAVISSSPERLLSVRGRKVETRPIAGTRRRDQPAESADASRQERMALLTHPKERAEHIMLIDLERNDLGRVCEPGSVEVNELLGLESYAHVHHIVSNVRGRLRGDCSPVDALKAVFPGGTITGCPKVRCMEIIAELEGAGRGPYTGAMGYLDRSGQLDMNILIRTLEQQGRDIRFRAGAGIVADSDAQAELQETRAKAAGLLKALGVEH